MEVPLTTWKQLALRCFFVAAIALYGLSSLWVILGWSPHVPYADQWRQFVTFLTMPFPDNILAPDNGHRQTLSNLIAWIELRVFPGGLWLQLILGVFYAAAAAMLIGRIAWRDGAISAHARASGAFLATFAIFWLGNARVLAHTGELMHVYPTIFFLVVALYCSRRAAEDGGVGRWLVGALLASFAATISFGYGMASFIGVLTVLLLARASRASIAVTVAGFGAALLYYLGSRGADGVAGSMHIEPLANALVAARWLGSPVNYVFPYLWNADSAYLLPGPLAGIALHLSAALHPMVGDIAYTVWPQALVGGSGILLVLVMLVQTLRASEPPTATRLLGLGLAGFGLAAAGIIALSRLEYFISYPGQIYADRYLPWPCLFWLGAALGVLGRRDGSVRWPQVTVSVFAACIAVGALPAHRGGYIYAKLVYGHVNNTATAAVTGVIQRDTDFGETVQQEMLAAIPVLQAAGVAPFSWPESRALGHAMPAGALRLDHARVQPGSAIDSARAAGYAVTVNIEGGAPVPSRVGLVDGTGSVVGVATLDPAAGSATLTGYALGMPNPDVALAAWRLPAVN
ncbi:MAG: hypothetical protein ABI411_13110 [Tahibacter sp.]